MDERYQGKGNLYIRRVAAAALAASLAIGLLGGCSSDKHAGNHYPGKTPPIGRCFDKPIPLPKSPAIPRVPGNIGSSSWQARYKEYLRKQRAYDQVNDPSPLVLRPGPGNVIKGDPISLPQGQQNKVNNATVKIVDSGGYGTGVIVRGPKRKHGPRQEEIVTAAHVVTGTHGRITIIDDNDRRTHVVRGCYVYQNGNKLSKSEGTDQLNTLDMAVLVPAKRIGGKALKLAKTEPPRGAWVFYTNNEARFIDGSVVGGDPTSPTSFAGIMLTNQASPMGLEALSGIQPWYGKDSWEEYSLTPGGSGGALTEGTMLVGITDAGTESNYYLDNGDVETESPGYMRIMYDLHTVDGLGQNPGVAFNNNLVMPARALSPNDKERTLLISSYPSNYLPIECCTIRCSYI